MPETALRATDPQDNLSRLEATYAADAAFMPELDLPVEPNVAEVSQRSRGADGKFVAEPKPGESQTYRHNRTVAQLAKDLGYSEDEIGRTEPAILEDRVYHVHRRTVEMMARERELLGKGIHADTGGSKPVPAAPVVEEEPDLSFLDEGLQKHLKQQAETIKSLKAKLDGQEQVATAKTQEQQMDQLFKELDRKDLFGEGGIRELVEDAVERDRRLAVVNKARTIQQGTWKEKLTKATERLFGASAGGAQPGREQSAYDAPSGLAVPETLQQRREDWDDGALSRPSHRKPGPLSPETRAAMKANEIMRENPSILGDFSDDREP